MLGVTWIDGIRYPSTGEGAEGWYTFRREHVLRFHESEAKDVNRT